MLLLTKGTGSKDSKKETALWYAETQHESKAHTHTFSGCLTILWAPNCICRSFYFQHQKKYKSFRSLFRFSWHIQVRCYVFFNSLFFATWEWNQHPPPEGFRVLAWDCLSRKPKRGTPPPKKNTWNLQIANPRKGDSYWDVHLFSGSMLEFPGNSCA